MAHPRRIDDALYAHFITFSCYHRRRLLDHDQPKRIVLGILNAELERHAARCVGFVLMPNHVHAIVWFPQTGKLSGFMRLWKGRSSAQIKECFAGELAEYSKRFPPTDPVWQVRYYSFEIDSGKKLREKLDYMHWNPVRAGLVLRPEDWRWSSARWYSERRAHPTNACLQRCRPSSLSLKNSLSR